MNKEKIEQAIRDLLVALEQDPNREGIEDTPRRVAKAWVEILQGYKQDPAKVLKTSSGKQGFTVDYDQMITLSNIPFYSTCEHHLLPFYGIADVGYIPCSQVVGLSKLARIVDVFARRLQIQEQLTSQIANAIQEHLNPIGVGVRIRAVHQCMACRGVNKSGTMATEILLGNFRSHSVRSEFWNLINNPLPRDIK